MVLACGLNENIKKTNFFKKLIDITVGLVFQSSLPKILLISQIRAAQNAHRQ